MEKNIPKFYLISLSLFIFTISTFSQQWTDPINISNLPGLDNQVDLCIDKNGTLHCVFVHMLASNWRKIYYTKSTNDGQTWTTPEDISINDNLSLMNPHIAVDTNNVLYATYDYNSENPNQMMIYLRTNDESGWTEPFLISEGLYGSHQSHIIIDHANRIYIVWNYLTHLTYYRYFENNVWTDPVCPYLGDHLFNLGEWVVDPQNNLHFAGSFAEGYPPVYTRVIYVKYFRYENYWSNKSFISDDSQYGSGDYDIDLDNQIKPHIVYRQQDYYSFYDSTMYSYYNGNLWTEPELVINDPYGQRIAIDKYNKVHVFDWEKIESGFKIVHYQKFNGLWQGYIVDSADFYLGSISLIKSSQKLYITYYRSDIEGEGEIYFTNFDIVTGCTKYNDLIPVNEFSVFPNPFKSETAIEFKMESESTLNISIFDLFGKRITTIDENIFSTGIQKLKWNGTDKNRKEVNPGTYLIRLQAGRHVITKPVEKIK